MFINEKVDSLLRHLLTVLASYLIAKGIFPSEVVNEVVGGAIALFSIGWSIYAKSVFKDQIAGLLRQVLTAAAVFVGALSPELIDTIISAVTLIGIIWLGWDDKEQVRQVKPNKEPDSALLDE